MTFPFSASAAFALIALAGSLPTHAAIPAAERDTLTALYASTNGSEWTTQTNWNGAAGTECNWYGVTCDATSAHVTGISLSTNNLTGTLPPISALTTLNTFIVGGLGNCIGPPWNQIGGTLPDLLNLLALVDFEVACNQFIGSIPALNGLSNLTTVYVHANHLTGSIPSLDGLTNLSVFDARDNNLTGSIPSLGDLANLFSLDLRGNQLSGSIPSLSALTHLKYFFVYSNDLTGTIPSLSGLTDLVDFYVDHNQLTGTIPSLSELSNLEFLVVGSNHLTGTLPPAPVNIVGAYVCPNDFPSSSYIDDAAWDKATQVSPWYTPCNLIFVNGFEDGIGVP